MNVTSLKIPSIIDNIKIVESFVENVKTKHNINDDIFGNMMIAVTESVTNAIIHGNKNNKEKNVILSMEEGDKEITFNIKDEGVGFDYLNLPDPTAPENLLKPGGRGIFIISNLCDKYMFEEKGKSINLIFKIK